MNLYINKRKINSQGGTEFLEERGKKGIMDSRSYLTIPNFQASFFDYDKGGRGFWDHVSYQNSMGIELIFSRLCNR